MGVSEERALRNEQTFRAANEQIDRRRRELSLGGRMPYICECAAERCTELVHLSVEEYRRVRDGGERHFLLVPGHELGGERVVETADGYVIVEKPPDAGERP